MSSSPDPKDFMKALQKLFEEKRPYSELFGDAMFRTASIEPLFSSALNFLKHAEDVSDLRSFESLLVRARDKTDLLIYKIRDEIRKQEDSTFPSSPT